MTSKEVGTRPLFMKKNKLTPKQAMFVKEYLVDLNCTQAAIRAGYSKKTSYSIGQELLKKIEIQEAVKKAMEKREAKVALDAQFVLNGLKEIYAKCTQQEEVYKSVYVKGKGEKMVKTKGHFNPASASKALELIGKHLGMFPTSVKLSGDKNNPLPSGVNIYLPSNGRDGEIKID